MIRCRGPRALHASGSPMPWIARTSAVLLFAPAGPRSVDHPGILQVLTREGGIYSGSGRPEASQRTPYYEGSTLHLRVFTGNSTCTHMRHFDFEARTDCFLQVTRRSRVEELLGRAANLGSSLKNGRLSREISI